MKTSIIIGLIVLSSLALASCSDTTQKTPISTNPAPTSSVTSTSTPKTTSATSTNTSMAGMDHSKMDMGTSTDSGNMTSMDHMGASTEEEFIANMIPHHQEAVDTASIIVAKTENVELKKIAQNIVSAQKTEISLLNSWMKTWYPNSTLKINYMPMMRDLSKLSDHDLDDAFMEDMVKHHEGAVHMAEEVLEVSQRPEIVQMANDIIRTQNAEIKKFKELLGNH
ncbi:MAG: hypothetical protein HHAS10_05040 [Candidatus Altimarinota bacterium]